MQALYYFGSLKVIEAEMPSTAKGEALIRTVCAGICATDREIARGYMKFRGIPGHEFSGIVEACDDDSWVGKRVVGEINTGCGECDYCLQGLQRHCPDRTTLGIMRRNGVFAEYFTLPEENLLEIPDSISDREAVFIEPLAAALEILEQVKIQPDRKVLLIGDGKLAALIAGVFRLHGSDITISGRSEKKLNYFRQLGLPTRKSEPELDSFDIVVEASGSSSGWDDAVRSVKPRGMIVLKSTYASDLTFNPAPVVIKEITIVGSRCGRFAPAVRLLEQGLIEVKPLISAVYPFEEILAAFEFANHPDTMKILVEMTQ